MNENDVEQNLLADLRDLGWATLNGPDDIESNDEHSYTDTYLRPNLIAALQRLNPDMSSQVLADVVNKLTRTSHNSLIDNNHDFHRNLINGVTVEYRSNDGEIRSDIVKVIDFDNITNNEFLAINQLTIVQGNYKRRPDVILFVNGLPLVIIELKNPTDSKADMQMAYNQLQTYKRELSDFFHFNELTVISDGLDAQIGTMTSSFERMMPWKTINGEKLPSNLPQLNIMAKGVFDKARLLDIIRNFIVFEKSDNDSYNKKLAAYHQYWVVQKAIDSTLRASSNDGDGRAGVVWHTQGSGKSLSMVFYASRLIHLPAFHNPTIVVITDRNDLDGQLFSNFCNCQDLLGEEPKRADSRRKLRSLLCRQAGGIIFTTIQKFSPDDSDDAMSLLTDRHNVIVIADEAHRSQYGFNAHINTNNDNQSHLSYGYAKYMRDALPNASYIGFTGTPIELKDRSTPAVFGDIIDTYDIHQAVDDGATVPIYYEGRLVDLGIDESTKRWLDNEIDDLLDSEDESRQDSLKHEFIQKTSIIGNDKRLERVASDIVSHFEQRQESFSKGKAMIATVSRGVAVKLYDKIVAIRPQWHSNDDNQGAIKVVITGAAGDPAEMQPHIRNKERLKLIEKRMKDCSDPLKIVIVCDMWLTGFDVPCLTTMYLDKTLKGYTLMQAIARVNRIYPGKNGGLIVDYLGVANALSEAMRDYTASGGTGTPKQDVNEAVSVMQTCYDVVRGIYSDFDYKQYFAEPTGERLQVILDAVEHILSLPDGERRYRQAMSDLKNAYALAMPQPAALAIREDLAFFDAVRARLDKIQGRDGSITDDEYRAAVEQLVERAIVPSEVINVFEAAGLQNPNISILNDAFVANIRNTKRKNVAIAALQKLITTRIKTCFAANITKERKFSELLQSALDSYKNGSIEAAQMIEKLLEIGAEVEQSANEDNSLSLSQEAKAFYDILSNDNANGISPDELKEMSNELTSKLANSLPIDWQNRTNAQASARVIIKKVLLQHGYTNNINAVAQTVMEQTARNESLLRSQQSMTNRWGSTSGETILR